MGSKPDCRDLFHPQRQSPARRLPPRLPDGHPDLLCVSLRIVIESWCSYLSANRPPGQAPKKRNDANEREHKRATL